MTNRLALLLASTSLFAACATTAGEYDELAGETDDASTGDGKADGAADGVYTYFDILTVPGTPGGFQLSRLNRSTTTCADGATHDSCFVNTLDWSEAGLGLDQQAQLRDAAYKSAHSAGTYGIVRGRFAKSPARFVVTEAWVSETAAISDGVFVKVKDSGVRCIAAPCADKLEKSINNSTTAAIAEIDYQEASLAEGQIQSLIDGLFAPEGIIVAGRRYTVHENGRSAKGRTATAAYRRLAPAAAH